MSYLVFIVAVGAFALLGAGGPLHRDTWLELLNRRVDAIELDLWPSLALRVAAPLIGAALLLWLLSGLVGGLAEALIGIALLYFAWGRGDYPTDLEKFLARARVGDVEGAQMLLSDASVGLWGAARGPCAPRFVLSRISLAGSRRFSIFGCSDLSALRRIA